MIRFLAGVAFCFGLTESLNSLKVSPEGYYWAGKNGDLLRTGSAALGPSMQSLEGEPAWSWHEKGNSVIRAAPLIDEKKNIYLSTIPGNVHKFTPDGVELWKYKDTAQIPEVGCLYKGSMFVTNSKGVVTKLDMESGQAIWKKSALVKGATRSAGDTWSMTAAEGVVISAVSKNGQNNEYLVALDAETGQVKWSFQPDNIVFNSLQGIKEGSVVFSDSHGKVYKLDLDSGNLIWKAGPGAKGEAVRSSFSTGGTVIGPNGIVYTTSNAVPSTGKTPSGMNWGNGFVTAFDFKDGRVLWRHNTEYQANNGAAVGMMNGRLAVAIGVGENPDNPNPVVQLFGARDGSKSLKVKRARVVALDARTGE